MISHRGTPSHAKPRRLAIISGGFSGAAIVYHIAAQARHPVEIVLIEPYHTLGRGLAYLPHRHPLLLNVPAGKLSIDPKVPGDFHLWCEAAGRTTRPDAFLPRAWFGEYVEARMAERVAASAGRVRLRHVHESAIGIRQMQPGLEIQCSLGTAVCVDHAVLALGHGPTRVPEGLRRTETGADLSRIMRSPWDEAAMTRVATTARRVMLVGTGLTMCDAAVVLVRSGFEGEIVAVSRRAQLPKEHGPSNPSDHTAWAASLVGLPLRALLSEVRGRATEENWRGVIDSLRSHTSAIWSALGDRDRDRFVARLSAYWDSHRHRMPAEVASAIHVLLRSGRLRIARGGIRACRAERDQFLCDIVDARSGWSERIVTDAIVLCTGGETDPSRWGSKLINDLTRQGLVSVDAHGLGILTDSVGMVLSAEGTPDQRLSTIGPLRRGDLWESTAVPELSKQAEALAQAIVTPIAEKRHQPLTYPQKQKGKDIA